MGDNFEKLRFVFENDALRLKMREHFVLRIIHHRLFLAYLERQFVGAPLCIPNYKTVMGVKTSKMNKNTKQDYFADFKSYSAD